MTYDSKSLREVAKENQDLARALGDYQNSERMIQPKVITRIVNALLNGGNMLEQVARDQDAASVQAYPPTA